MNDRLLKFANEVERAFMSELSRTGLMGAREARRLRVVVIVKALEEWQLTVEERLARARVVRCEHQQEAKQFYEPESNEAGGLGGAE